MDDKLNEEDGSYKAKEKKLLSQKDSELREDYKYGSSVLVLERLGGYKKFFKPDSLNENDSEAKENKLLISSQEDGLNENSFKAKKEELLISLKNSFSKSEENDFGFEVLKDAGGVTKAEPPPYFSILADALKNDNENNKFCEEACDYYELFSISSYELEDLKNFHTHKKKLLTSISSGKNGGAFTVQPKYKINTVTNDYEPVSWLVLDCHGGSHKILKTFEELYNFLEFGKVDEHHLALHYTDPQNFEKDDLTKKYYLADSNEKYKWADNNIIITE